MPVSNELLKNDLDIVKHILYDVWLYVEENNVTWTKEEKLFMFARKLDKTIKIL